MGKAQETHKNFDRMVLRVVGDDIVKYNEVMRGTVADLTSAHIAFIEQLVIDKKRKRHGR